MTAPVCMSCGWWPEYPDGHHPRCAERPRQDRTGCTCRNPYVAGGMEAGCPVHGVPEWLQEGDR